MYELKANEYDKARPIFQAMDHNMAVTAILEGGVRSSIYADDPAHPQTALTRSGQRFYLAGATDNHRFNQALRRFFVETVYNQARASGAELFVLYYTPDEWAETIDELLADKSPIKVQRQFYAFEKLRNDWRTRLPDGFALRSVDEALLEEKDLGNYEALTEEMCCELGVETFAPYRRRGLATVMASALIEEALARGVSRIGWHCYATNAGSIATARNVGFKKVKD